MFKVIEDKIIEELVFNCASCGEEQICYTDIIPMIHCLKCNRVLNPNPIRLLYSQAYRSRYHFRKEAVNAGKTES
jgi:hypothetical protein